MAKKKTETKKTSNSKTRLNPDKRRSSILKAASNLFLKKGFSGTTLDAIIEKSGGSKRNIYSEFKDKEGLFSAIISRESDVVVAKLSIKPDEDWDLYRILFNFANTIMDVLTSPPALNLYRIAMAEGQNLPKLAKIFFEKGAGRSIQALIVILEKAKERGEINVEDCSSAANLFVSLLRGSNMFMEMALKLRGKPTRKEQDDFVNSVVMLFLNGIKRN